MMLSRSPRSRANGQDVTSPELSDEREAVKSPVNPMDFSTLAKQTRSGLLLERAYGSIHKDEV